MRNILTLIIACSIAFTSFGQTGNSDKTGPVIKFEKTTHNFGELEENTTATYKFKYTNEGDVPLVLQKVQASCGCTKPQYSQAPLMPGQSEYINVGFKTAGYGGRSFSKSITVVTNAKEGSDSKLVIIYIKGKVNKKETTPPKPESPVRVTPH